MKLGKKDGFIFLLTFIFLAALTIITSAILFMITTETRDVGAGTTDNQLLYLAEAGVQRAVKDVRDEETGASVVSGVVDLLGSDTTGSLSITNPDHMLYIGDGTATINNNNDEAWVRTFNCDYVNSIIVSVQLGVRASRANGGSGATIEVAYTTNGAFPQVGNTVLSQALTTTLTNYFTDVTSDRTWTWATLMDSNFILRARRTAGNRNINLDSLFLRITYQIDTLNEPWATGSYASFPISLGGGTIQSVAITDETAKVHLNYASQALLANLLTNLSISNAATKATDIVNYRGAALTNPFDSVEELQQVSSITAADYLAIKDYVTVYSSANSSVTRLSGPRVPVNINTASFAVLKAIFDSDGLGAGESTTLANDIISTRPFAGFYSADSVSNTYFYNFARSRAYLSTAGNPDEQDKVLDTADGSSLVPVSGSTGFNCPTTELCYASSAFYINSLAQAGGRNFRLKTVIGSEGSRVLSNYVGDPTQTGYNKTNFE